jgi:carbonic anhydrase/acetyltransferase-like protein (isoleucine patch superfamily)
MASIRAFAGQRPRIAADAWVDESAVVIGDVEIGARSSVWPMTVIRGDIHQVRIGNDTNIQDGSILHVSHDSRFVPGGHPLVLHDHVTVGHQVVLHGCEIHHHCLIGIGARVLDGVCIEPFTLVGAGALVPPGKVLQGGYLWVGAPVRRVRVITDQEQEYLVYTAEHYTRLAQRHRESVA